MVERLVLGEGSAMRARGAKTGLAGVSGECSRVVLPEAGRNEVRRNWLPAEVSIAAGTLAPFGLVWLEVAGEDACMDEGNDWRLELRAMRDWKGRVSVCVVLTE